MFRNMLRTKIHRATVTGADLNYEGSIGIDEDLLDMAGIASFESVHIWNVTNGERLMTYAIPLGKGTGEVVLNGAAAPACKRETSLLLPHSVWWKKKKLRHTRRGSCSSMLLTVRH